MSAVAVRGRRSRGQALPEFALVAPLFFLLLFGIIEAGRFIYYYEILSNATREGARYAIVNGAGSSEVPHRWQASCSSVLTSRQLGQTTTSTAPEASARPPGRSAGGSSGGRAQRRPRG